MNLTIGRVLTVFIALFLAGCLQPETAPTMTPMRPMDETGPYLKIKLPQPRTDGEASLEWALRNRRSVREYAATALSLDHVSQLLWSAQGISAPWGGRTAPSAGALYPIELYLVVGNVHDLGPGVYQYQPGEHTLLHIRDDDLRNRLALAALGQTWMRDAAVFIVVVGVYETTTQKYGERGIRYVHMEAGHAAQNMYLQAAAMDLGMVTVGAFLDEAVRRVLGLPAEESPLYLVPIGPKG